MEKRFLSSKQNIESSFFHKSLFEEFQRGTNLEKLQIKRIRVKVNFKKKFVNLKSHILMFDKSIS